MSEKGMPSAPDVERFVLGSILLNDAFYIQAAGQIEADDFSLEKHRRIFKRMGDLSGARRADRPRNSHQRVDAVQRAGSLATDSATCGVSRRRALRRPRISTDTCGL